MNQENNSKGIIGSSSLYIVLKCYGHKYITNKAMSFSSTTNMSELINVRIPNPKVYLFIQKMNLCQWQTFIVMKFAIYNHLADWTVRYIVMITKLTECFGLGVRELRCLS